MIERFVSFEHEFSFAEEDNEGISSYRYLLDNLKSENWEQDTFSVFKRNRNKEKAAIDIGAWIGPTSAWLSANFKHVFSFEPDFQAIKALKLNLERMQCNNVTIIEKAVTSSEINKVYFGKNTSRSKSKVSFGDSTSQHRFNKEKEDDYQVDAMAFDEIMDSFNENGNVSLVKIDIEGGEEMILQDVFRGSEQFDFNIWLSFHYSWWKNPDLSRFEDCFSVFSHFHVYRRGKWIKHEIVHLVEMVQNNPFISVYFEKEGLIDEPFIS